MEALATVLQHGTWHMGDGWGWWMMIGWLWMLIFWGVVIWAAVFLARRVGGSHEPPRGTGSSALQILEERYARGELSDEEFEAKRHRLSGA